MQVTLIASILYRSNFYIYKNRGCVLWTVNTNFKIIFKLTGFIPRHSALCKHIQHKTDENLTFKCLILSKNLSVDLSNLQKLSICSV